MVKFEQLIEQIKETPVSLEFLRTKLPQRCAAVQYKHLKKHRSEVFKANDAVVVLIPSKISDIGHFVVLLAKRNHIEYFSPLGGTPDSEMAKLGEPSVVIKELLGKHYIVNRVALQGGDFHISDCAVWCLLRCYLRKLKLREFQKLFQRHVTLNTPDDIAAALGVLLLIDMF